MIQKAIDILKIRKSDAIKVIAIILFCRFLYSVMTPLLNAFGLEDVAFTKLMTLPISFLLIFLPMILSLGFERLIVFFPDSQTILSECLKTGYKYFWRVFGFLVLLLILCFVLTFPLSIILKMIFALSPLAGLHVRIAFALAILLLVKYLYFIPAQIIVYDRSILASVSNMKSYRSKEINQFILLCLAIHASLLITSNVISFFLVRNSLPYVISMTCQTVVATPILFLLGLVAVLYVHRQFLSEQVGQPEESEQNNNT